MVEIEAYADMWCPFAYVGLRMVRGRCQQRGRNDVILHVRAWPLELINGRPQDVGAIAEHVRELREQISAELFVGFDPTSFPSTTLPSLALAARAYRQSKASGQAVSFAIREALFEEGRDISDPTVLDDIAERHDIQPVEATDRQSVLEDWRQGQSRGVKGSPHFFCGSSDVFCPSLDIAKSESGHVLIKRNRQALDAFLDSALGTETPPEW